jgi:hypothetical protein
MAAIAPKARVRMETAALEAPLVPVDEDAAAALVVEEAMEMSAEPVRTCGW